MKSLSDLNGRWWYRLAKVVYIFVLAAVALLGVIIIYASSNEKEVDYSKTVLVCPNGQSVTLSALNQKISQNQNKIVIPVGATGPFFRGEKPSYFDLQALENGS